MVQPKMTESILVFDGQRVSRHLSATDFEAFIQGTLQLPFSGQHLKLAYVLLSAEQGRILKSVVLFHIEVAGNGRVPGGGNIPLRELAHRASLGPELTNGEQVCFACYSQCPMHEHQEYLWDLPTGTRQIYLNEISAAISRIEQTVEWRLILQESVAHPQMSVPPSASTISPPAMGVGSLGGGSGTVDRELSAYSSMGGDLAGSQHQHDPTVANHAAGSKPFSQEPLYVRQLIDAQETRLRVLREQQEKLLEEANAKYQLLLETNIHLKQESQTKDQRNQELSVRLEHLLGEQMSVERRSNEQEHASQQELNNYKQQVLKQKRLIKQQQDLMHKMKSEQSNQTDRLNDLRVDYDALQEEYQQISEAYQQALLKPSAPQNQFENVIDIKAIKQLKEKLSSRETELNREVGHRLATEQQLQDTISTLNKQISQLSGQSVDALIEDMQEQQIVCVSHLDDGGHLVIMPEDVLAFLENPDSFKEGQTDDNNALHDQTDSVSNS